MRNHYITVRLSGVLLLLLLSAASACRQPETADSVKQTRREKMDGVRGGQITVRLTALPKTFNPLLISDEASLLVCQYLLHARLLDFNHDVQTWVPALAESWQTEGATVMVVLREQLKFSDGQPLTAEDVVFTFRALYDARTGATLLRDAMTISGKPIEAIAIDARTVRLTFPEVVAAPESYLMNLPVLPKHQLLAAFEQGQLSSQWGLATAAEQIITAGPFVVETVQSGEYFKLKRNPNYWKKDPQGTQLPYLDQVVLEAISDANTTLLRLTQGTIDLADRIRVADYASLQTPTKVRAHDAGPGLSTDYFWFNLNKGRRGGGSNAKQSWFNEVRFRRAVAHAVDRATIAQNTLRGLATPLQGFVSPGNRAWIAKNLLPLDYDLQRSQALLQEAGFVLRGSAESPELFDQQGQRVTFTLLVQAENEPRKQMATVIQQDLAKLGINMQIATLETQAMMERWQKTFDYDAVLMGLTVTDIDPSSYSGFLRSDSPSHQWAPQQAAAGTEWEKRIDELMKAQARETDRHKRQAIFQEIQRIMHEQMPIIPIVARHVLTGVNTGLGNYRPISIFPYSLWNIEELFWINT